MKVPLKLKWLGKETGELCNLIAPFHPLILISPAPQVGDSGLPSGMVRLPHKICRVLDLQVGDLVSASELTAANDLAFDALDVSNDAQSFSAIYDFYFEVYLKNSALKHHRRTSDYRYLEPFHSNLLERRFIALIRGLNRDQTVAGLLLRHPTAVELESYSKRLKPGASIGETDIAIVDVLSVDERSRHARSLVQHAAEWARNAGYSFLSSLPTSALITNETEIENDWTLQSKSITVWQEDKSALLHWDLRRCLYLSHDVYYYSLSNDNDEVSLHYIANVSPRHSRLLRLLSSTIDIEKKVYTRQTSVCAALSTAGIECEFLNPAKVSTEAEMVNS